MLSGQTGLPTAATARFLPHEPQHCSFCYVAATKNHCQILVVFFQNVRFRSLPMVCSQTANFAEMPESQLANSGFRHLAFLFNSSMMPLLSDVLLLRTLDHGSWASSPVALPRSCTMGHSTWSQTFFALAPLSNGMLLRHPVPSPVASKCSLTWLRATSTAWIVRIRLPDKRPFHTIVLLLLFMLSPRRNGMPQV